MSKNEIERRIDALKATATPNGFVITVGRWILLDENAKVKYRFCRRGGLVRRTILIPICNAKRPAIQISNYICNSPQSYSGRRSNSSSNICNSFTDTSQVGYPKSPTIFQKSPKILLYTQLFSHFVTQKSLPSARPASRVQQYRRTCLVELPT